MKKALCWFFQTKPEHLKYDVIFLTLIFLAVSGLLMWICLLINTVAPLKSGDTVIKKEMPVVRWHEVKRTITDENAFTELPKIRVADDQIEETHKASMTYLGEYWITGYDACIQCCGNTSGITASGERATTNRTVAMCRDYPFGTRIYIEGLGYYKVEDRGVGQGCVDIFCNNHNECANVTGYRNVWIVN